MGFRHPWTLASWISILCTLALSFVIPYSDNLTSTLERPQDQDSNYDSFCFAPCAVDTCSSSSTCSARRLKSRALSPSSEFEFADATSSNSSSSWPPVADQGDGLVKRLFTLKPGSDTPPQYTIGEIRTYLPNQINQGGAYDNQYGNVVDFTIVDQDGDESEATATWLKSFGKNGFQLGTGGLHGCTMATIISNRAVWMAHFWEATAFLDDGEDPDDEHASNDSPNQKTFKEMAINALTGDRPIKNVVGDPVDVNQFNAGGDNTAAYIMTPYKFGFRPAEGSQNSAASLGDLRYPTKITELKNAILSILPNARVVIYGYVALNYRFRGQKAQAFSSERGMALFQYDPSSDGKNNAGYRLFYEATSVRGQLAKAKT